MRYTKSKPRYRLNTRGKILIGATAAAVAVVVLLLVINPFRSGDPSFLKDVQAPDWVDVDYIDMYVNARQGDELEEINGVVIHYVGNPGSSAAANRNYFNNAGTEVVSHFIVGLEGEVIECLPLYEKSVSSNERNRDTISIETCHPDDSGQFTDVTYDSLVRLTAWIVKTCDLKKSDIIRHHDITGKLCPKYFVENEDAWDEFKDDVMQYIKDNPDL